jgi:hypothetical protein
LASDCSSGLALGVCGDVLAKWDRRSKKRIDCHKLLFYEVFFLSFFRLELGCPID